MRKWKLYKLCSTGIILLLVLIWGNQVYLTNVSTKGNQDDKTIKTPKYVKDDQPPLAKLANGNSSTKSLHSKQLKLTRKDDSSPRLNVLLMASYRSGSSFTGELLRQNSKMLYLYEPFKIFMSENRTIDNGNLGANIRAYIPSLFNCRYIDFWMAARSLFPEEAKERVYWYNKLFKQLIARHKASGMKDMELICSGYSMRSMKIIRNHLLSNIFPLLNTSSEQYLKNNMKVLHLVRDPRGIAVSRHLIDAWQRQKVSFLVYLNSQSNVEKIVNTAKQICLHYEKNLDFLQSLGCTYQGLQSRLAFIRYEDIAYHPLHYAYSIYSFLNISVPAEVLDWVTQSTTQNISGYSNPYGTVRNSTSTAEKWRRLLPYYIAERIDNTCGDVLTRLGYSPVSSLEKYHNSTFSLVNDLPTNIPCGLH